MLDLEDLERAWNQYADKLLLILRPLGGATEDAVQEAFIALSELRQLPDCPLAWLVTVARNRLIQWQRTERRREGRQAQAARNWFNQSSTTTAIDTADISNALSKLPRSQAEVITMRIWGEMNFEQIATVIGKSRSSTHRTYVQGLSQLRQELTGVPFNEQ